MYGTVCFFKFVERKNEIQHYSMVSASVWF